jgi:hypothetical protein
MKRNYAERYLDNIVVIALAGWMRQCRAMNQSFDDCLKEARRQFNKEVREAALEAPLPK